MWEQRVLRPKTRGLDFAKRNQARVVTVFGREQGEPFFETGPTFGFRPKSLSGFGPKSSK
jgi:hypothetical protein